MDSDSMDTSEYIKKINKGIYLAGLDGSQMQNKEGILSGQGFRKAGYMPLSPLEDAAAVSRYQENLMGNRELTISSTCKHPEQAMEFLDWCFSEEGARILLQGTEGPAWNREEEAYALIEEYKKDAVLGIVEMAEKYGKEKYAAMINQYVQEMVMECVFAADQEEFTRIKEKTIKTAEDMEIWQVAEWYGVRLEEICKELMPVLEDTLMVSKTRGMENSLNAGFFEDRHGSGEIVEVYNSNSGQNTDWSMIE